MGGMGVAITEREAASALRWWLEMGVDIAIQEDSRNWLQPRRPAPAASEARPAAPLPDTLLEFQEWLSTNPEAPLASARSRAVLPQGAADAEIMVLCEPPTREELASGTPIAGAAAELMQRMLQAIEMADRAYVANLACFHSPVARLNSRQIEDCASAARRHVTLARPKRLLLVGDEPCRALLGKPLLQARGHVHRVDCVRTIATFHPRDLLNSPSKKALAWEDLLLLTEEAL